MAVGTNDIFDPPAFGAQVERAMAIAGPKRTVYWVNVEVSRFRQSADVQAADRANSAWINQQLEEAAARHPNLKIIHWSEFLNSQPAGPGKYLRDGVHTSRAGRPGRAQRTDRRRAPRQSLRMATSAPPSRYQEGYGVTGRSAHAPGSRVRHRSRRGDVRGHHRGR